MVLGFPRSPSSPEGGSAGNSGPAPSIHGLLGQGQRVQCKPLVQARHSLIGMLSSTQTRGNSW